MHAFVTSLTAAALLTHALVGCYGHRALTCSQCERVATVALSATSCCDHEHEHSTPAENHLPAGPYKCVLYCDGSCVSLPPQKTELDAAPIVAWFDFVAADHTAHGPFFGAWAGWERGEDSSAHQPPLRLHLLHQALLI